MGQCAFDRQHCSPLHARLSLTAAAVTALAQSTGASGQCDIRSTEKLVAPDGRAGDRFGQVVAIDGDVLVVGAYRDDDMCNPGSSCNSGSVHVYRRIQSQWFHETELHPDDLAPGDQFGRAIALAGDTLLVGSPLDDDDGGASGSVYVFIDNNGQWTQQTKLTAADAASGDTFGDAVAIDGDTAVIGALMDDHAAGLNAGSAYVFTRSAGVWSQQAKLTADDAESASNFGNAVDIHGNVVIVGAENADDPQLGRNTGAAYVFMRSGPLWSQTQKLTAGSMQMDARFGWAVKVLGETAVISALEEDNRGAVYVFSRNLNNHWSPQQRLRADDTTTLDDFGHSLALGETMLIIGAAYDDDACGGSPSCDSGSAYIFNLAGNGWTQGQKLTAPDAAADDEFGYSAAMSDGTIVIGARMNEQLGIDAGAAYIFTTDCRTQTCTGDLDGNGSVDVGDFILLISAWGEGPQHSADLNDDGVVNVFDLIRMLSQWGPCQQSPLQRTSARSWLSRSR